MDFTAPHIGFVLAAYGVTAVVLALAIALQVRRAWRTAGRLAELEGRAAPRRRAAKAETVS
jgi:hypothetical protein